MVTRAILHLKLIFRFRISVSADSWCRGDVVECDRRWWKIRDSEVRLVWKSRRTFSNRCDDPPYMYGDVCLIVDVGKVGNRSESKKTKRAVKKRRRWWHLPDRGCGKRIFPPPSSCTNPSVSTNHPMKTRLTRFVFSEDRYKNQMTLLSDNCRKI